jgi:hypothetical protein
MEVLNEGLPASILTKYRGFGPGAFPLWLNEGLPGRHDQGRKGLNEAELADYISDGWHHSSHRQGRD